MMQCERLAGDAMHKERIIYQSGSSEWKGRRHHVKHLHLWNSTA